MFRPIYTFLLVLPLLSQHAIADAALDYTLPMQQQVSGAYYVQGVFVSGVASDLLVDTGSSYVVLSRPTFARLKRDRAAVFQRTIRGATAAGRVMVVKVYSISELARGDGCVLRGVEAVVVPGADHDILGLSALRHLQPFALQFEPPELRVSACSSPEPIAVADKASAHSAGG